MSAIATHLRYPNAHTSWYSSLLLALFSTTQSDSVREVTLRVLLERVIVARPQVWGVLYTFSRLLAQHNVLELAFVQKSQEIVRLLRACADKSNNNNGGGSSNPAATNVNANAIMGESSMMTMTPTQA